MSRYDERQAKLAGDGDPGMIWLGPNFMTMNDANPMLTAIPTQGGFKGRRPHRAEWLQMVARHRNRSHERRVGKMLESAIGDLNRKQ